MAEAAGRREGQGAEGESKRSKEKTAGKGVRKGGGRREQEEGTDERSVAGRGV
jgi:hypothetical protein